VPDQTAPGHASAATVDEILQRIVLNDHGLFPAIVQQWDSREVLMLGWMDAEAFRRTMTEGRVTFWSRSRQ
jgi:phosphoribosyl-AMP cyclohydrolase